MSSDRIEKSYTTNARELAACGICTALLVICSWISVPMAVPFTMQTFGVFFTLKLLGGRRGLYVIISYILLGAVGLPVFAGFKAGISALLGTTGGYILGFIFTALVYIVITHIFGDGRISSIIALLLGHAGCYTFGTLWFIQVYGKNTGPIGVATALGWCVIPFIIPDIIKMVLAFCAADMLSGRVKL